uniref:Uncharacterized protein n=1 Tax=Caenorhabditis japonica TaxID=281687 RepID=A0A8R1DX47_CAEJA
MPGRNKIKNVAAYHLLKELLGEESKYNKSVKSAKIEEPDSSERAASPMDTSGNTEEIREEDEESPKRLARKAKTNEVLPQFLLDRQSGLGEADEGDDADDDNDGNAVDDEPSTPAKKKAKRPKADSDEDEEYTPTKKSRKTAKTTPTRGGKRGGRVAGGEKIATPKRATRSAARGRGRPKKLGAGTREEAHEILPENIKKEPREEPKEEKQEQEEKEDTPTDKTPKPVSDTLFYVACGTERWTNVRRPVVLRLRGLYDQDKKFYDEETLKKMTVALEEESPASPAQSQDGPASPDMAPTTLQPVKTIPTTPQVPPDFCQPASPQSPPRNDDTKEPSIVAIPLEPTAAESVDMGQPASPTMDDEDGKNKSCIAEEPEEIAESVKCIPVESEAERELKKSQKDNNKYIEIIVLDMTWSQFENQVALVGDEAAIAEITEREKKVLGPEQSHDYTKLTGWYSPDSMFFYISKVVRALRKLQDRSAIFEKEIENMGRMVVYGQSPEYARQFALFLREEAYTIRPQLIPIVESAAGYFDQLCAMYELQTSKRNNLSVKDK